MCKKVDDRHPAIISQEIFDLAQAEYKNRSNIRSSSKTGDGRYSAKHALSCMLVCASCGGNLRRWYQGYGGQRVKRAFWKCRTRESFKTCGEKPISEDAIMATFVKLINELLIEKVDFISTLKENIAAVISDDLLGEIESLDAAITEIQQEVLRINRDNRNGVLSNADYDAAICALEIKSNELNSEKGRKILRCEQVKLLKYRTGEIERLLDGYIEMTEFDEFIFKELVDCVAVAGGKATYQLKCFLEKEIEL